MTGTALDLNHHPATALAIQPGQISWDGTQLAALNQLGLADASDGDRSVFLHVSQRTGLDPFARQIYMIPRREKVPGTQNWRTKWTIQTGIEGWRVIRDRAERRYGVRGTLSRAIWYDGDGNEHKVWVRPDPPAACELTYTVKDSDGTETPYTSVLQFREYAQTGSDGSLIAQWGSKKSHMLEKCTEADVYRKAFPQDFSGIYLDDTMPPQEEAPTAPPRGRVTAGEVIGRGDADGQEAPKAPPRTARRGKAAGDAQGKRKAGTETPRPDGDDEPAEDQPGSASKDQLTRLHTILTGLGFNGEDREQKLVIAEVITGHNPLTGPKDGRSSGNLSYTEAGTLIAKLDEFTDENGERDRDALIAYMAEREQAGDD
jgi:phage recombination protein Bet